MRVCFWAIAMWFLLSGPSAAVDNVANPLISLSASLAPLREEFNANKDRFRVVALLSPT